MSSDKFSCWLLLLCSAEAVICCTYIKPTRWKVKISNTQAANTLALNKPYNREVGSFSVRTQAWWIDEAFWRFILLGKNFLIIWTLLALMCNAKMLATAHTCCTVLGQHYGFHLAFSWTLLGLDWCTWVHFNTCTSNRESTKCAMEEELLCWLYNSQRNITGVKRPYLFNFMVWYISDST